MIPMRIHSLNLRKSIAINAFALRTNASAIRLSMVLLHLHLRLLANIKVHLPQKK